MKHPPENKQAFTLPEVMMTVSILSIVYVMASSFIFSSMQVNAMTTGKTLVSRDIRQFTQRFGQDARAANHMSILKGIRTNQQVTQLNSGDTGDFILFYYQEYDYAEKKLTVYRVVGYYRLVEDASTGEGPVFRFSETGSWDTVNDYPLPRLHRRGLVSEATNQTLEVQEVVQLTRGLADGNLFYNYAQRRAVIVRGEIDNPGRMGQNAINTYNFTVFPRGNMNKSEHMTDISLNADSGASREGGALFLVIFAAALIGMMIPSMMAVTNSEMRMNAAAVRHSRARYAAESVLEHGFAQTDRLIRAQSHYDRFLLKRDGGLVQPAIPDIQADLTRGGWEVQDVELLAGIVPLGDRRFIDPSDDGNELDELRGQYVISRYVMMMAKATVAHGVLGTSTAYAQQYLEIRDSPLFAYAIFYNDIMGLTPGPHTEIHGPVHCNQHMILRPWGGLDYHSQVNTVGGYKRLGGEFTFPGLYGGQLTPEFTLTDGTKGWWDTFNFPPDADFVSEFGRWFGENLRTERHDLRQVYPPAFGDMVPLADGSPGLHRIIQAPLRRSDPRLSAEEWEELLPIEQQKFSTKAGIVFQVDVSPAPIPTLAAWGGLYDGTQLALHEDGRILYPTRVIRFDNDTNRPVLDAHGNYVFIDIPSTATREWFDSLDHQELLLRDNDKINITPWEARHAFLSTLYTEGQLYDVSIRAFRYEPSDSGDYFRNGERHTRVEITGSIPRLHDNSPDGIFRTHYHEGSPGSSGVFHKQTGRNFERDGQDRVTQWLLNSNEYGNFGNIPADFLPDGGPAPRMMWDSRRRQWVNMVDLDIGNLKKALDGGSLAPAWNGIVYVEFLHNGAPIEDTFQDVHGNLFPYEDRAYSRSGLRVINARRVPTTEGPDGLDDGFTLATNNAMYVKGSFNADGNMNTGTAQEPDVPSTDSAKAEVPTALIADSLTLLSDNWNDSMSRADVNRTRGSGVEGPNHRARPTHLEIAAAVITGMPPGDELPWDSRTVQFTHNGGPLNQLRLLEFFGEDVITRFRGSLVQLYEHTVSWEPWRLRYTYLPPRREYGFAQIFENGRYPPGTPTVQSFRRAIYRQIGPDTYGALANILKQTSAEDWSEKEYAEALNAVYGN